MKTIIIISQMCRASCVYILRLRGSFMIIMGFYQESGIFLHYNDLVCMLYVLGKSDR